MRRIADDERRSGSARNRHQPFGLRAAPDGCVAVAPQRCLHIACVAPARIRLGGARNATHPTCSEVP